MRSNGSIREYGAKGVKRDFGRRYVDLEMIERNG
jgi:hypothetical protein